MRTINADELSLYVWNTESLYLDGLKIARSAEADSDDSWRVFVKVAVESYRREIGPAQLDKGTVKGSIAAFKQAFAEYAAESNSDTR